MSKRDLSFPFLVATLSGIVAGSVGNRPVVATDELSRDRGRIVGISAPLIRQFDSVQLDVETSIQAANPFDADEICLNALFAAPSGNTMVVPCFYLRSEGEMDRWQCRFTAAESGKYSVSVRTSGRQLDTPRVSDVTSFQVEASDQRGFLRLGQNRSHRFLFDNGTAFRGVGENLGWEPRRRAGRAARWTYDYQLPLLQEHGCNTIRTWMCPWNLTLEWKSPGLGRYDPRAAERLDQLLALAQRHGIYVILVLDYHGQLRTKPDHWGANNEWKNNPYNAALGGPCQTPTDYFTNEEARRHYRNRLRYLVARWSYHPNLLAWELWNEVDIVMRDEKVPADAILQWHREMTEHLAGLDPFDHLITTSVSSRFPPALWELPHVDVTMLHMYGPTGRIPGELAKAVQQFEQPAIVSEFSYSWKSPGEVKDDESFEKELHLGLWRGMFSATPILPLTWWWEFHDQEDHWKHLRAAASFCRRMEEAGEAWVPLRPVCSVPALECHATRIGETSFVWVLNGGPSAVQHAKITLEHVQTAALKLEPWPTIGDRKTGQPAHIVDQGADRVVVEIGELQPSEDVAFLLEKS